jgi:hypothetical protein
VGEKMMLYFLGILLYILMGLIVSHQFYDYLCCFGYLSDSKRRARVILFIMPPAFILWPLVVVGAIINLVFLIASIFIHFVVELYKYVSKFYRNTKLRRLWQEAFPKDEDDDKS